MGEPQRQRHTLADATYTSVIDLYKAGKSIDDIVRVTGLMRETVHDILAGEYVPALKRKKIKPRRCPTCGKLVDVWPCVACVQVSCSPLIDPLEESGSQDHLSGSEEQRYREVKHWRIIYGSPAYNADHPLHRDTTKDKDKET